MRRPGTLRRPVALCLALLAVAVGTAGADDEFDFRLIRPVVTLSGWGAREAPFQVAGGNYRASTMQLNANIPLGPTHIHPDGKVLGHQFLLGATVSTTDQTIDIPALPDAPRLYAGALIGSAIWASSRGNFYLVSAGASFAEDENTIDDLDTRPFALFLGSWWKSKKLTFVYGGALSYVFGRELFLPAFGLVWRPNPDWTIAGAVPFYWRASQKMTQSLRMHYLLYVVGQRYRFANEGLFATTEPVVYERMVESHIGAELEYRATTDLSLLGQAGIAGGRRLSFADLDEEDFIDDRIDPAPYIKLSLRYAFGKSLLEEVQSHLGAAAGGEAP